MTGGPLDGVRVLDLTAVVVGPVCTQTLADHGAEVIKIEPPEGDLLRTLGGKSRSGAMASKFLAFNRNKRSLALDMKSAEGREIMARLVARSDVLVANIRPPALRRLGLGYDECAALNKRLIYCSLVGFGQRGRYRAKPAYDTIIQGSTGVAACYERATGEPRYVPMVMADHIVGLIAVQQIAMALYHRERTGAGQSIEVPMFENMAAFVLSEHLYLHTFEPPLGGTGDPRVINPEAKPLPTRDGHICISANTNAQAFGFFEAIGRPELKDDPRFCSIAARFAHVQDYFELRASALRSRTTAEWLEIFDRLDVPAMPYHTFESLLEDPHLADVGLVTEVEHPTEGRIRDVGVPNRWSDATRTDYRPPPKIGQHSVEILREIGYSEDQVGALVERAVIVDGRLKSGSKTA
jgi:crotonobetainyl-CoA:carnitine CoA-transferase CaiB-like acyl-CoA transferase